MQTLLKGAKVFRNGHFSLLDILVEDGIVVSLLEAGQHSPLLSEDALIYDFKNMIILPGLVDVHVHLREPGFSYKEDMASGTAAAAAGGYTDIFPMPNLKPVPDCPANLAEELAAIRDKACVHVHPYGSISRGEKGEELADMDGMAADAAAYSDDGVGVVSDDMMREAFRIAGRHGKLLAAHCEYKNLMGGAHVNAGPAAAALGIEGISNESEWRMIERDIRIAEEMGGAYHVCHVSTAESIELIRQAKKRGVNITCETGPHYLVLDEEDLVREIEKCRQSRSAAAQTVNKGTADAASQTAGTADAATLPAELARFKMNPPLRSRKDHEALIAGLKDGTIDMIATDHAPHSPEEKGRGILAAPMGVVGLETALPVMYTYVVGKGIISLERLAELMTSAPAARFGIESGIEEGRAANLCVYDLEDEYVIDPALFKTRGRSTPFEGMKVKGRCLLTMCDGRVVYKR